MAQISGAGIAHIYVARELLGGRLVSVQDHLARFRSSWGELEHCTKRFPAHLPRPAPFRAPGPHAHS